MIKKQVFLVFSVAFLSNSTSIFAQKSTLGFDYILPIDLGVKEKTELVEKLDKGGILFKNHCTSCHGVFAVGVPGIPNFSRRQLDSYKAKYVNQDKENHAFALKLSSEQLANIIKFLESIPKED